MPPVILTTELLDAFLERVVDAGVPGVERLQPGLPDRRIDEIMVGSLTELPMPHEGRVLWGWRNGTPPFEASALARGTRLLSLEEAVTAYFRSRANGYEQGLFEGPRFDIEKDAWPKGFLPFLDRQNLVAIDTTAPLDGPSPVHQIPIYDHPEDAITDPDLPSIGTLVQWWIDAFDSGLWRWDHRAGDRWDHSRDNETPFERRFYL